MDQKIVSMVEPLMETRQKTPFVFKQKPRLKNEVLKDWEACAGIGVINTKIPLSFVCTGDSGFICIISVLHREMGNGGN